MDLNIISKKNKKWISYANSLTKDMDEAKDIVQDMYLKMYNVDKEVDDFYVIATIRNIFFNKVKQKSKTVPLVFDIEVDSSYEINDEELDLINKFNDLKFYERILITENLDKSVRNIAKEYNVNYMFVYRKIKEAKNKILNEKKR